VRPRFVCEACASRRSHGVSAETPDLSSQSAPACCSHRAACAYCHPAYITALAPEPHITIPFSPSTRRSFGALPITVVADPVRRPSTATRFSFPPKLLPPTASPTLTYPSPRLAGLEPGTDPAASTTFFCLALLGLITPLCSPRASHLAAEHLHPVPHANEQTPASHGSSA
jgi:hypothetical protein